MNNFLTVNTVRISQESGDSVDASALTSPVALRLYGRSDVSYNLVEMYSSSMVSAADPAAIFTVSRTGQLSTSGGITIQIGGLSTTGGKLFLADDFSPNFVFMINCFCIYQQD